MADIKKILSQMTMDEKIGQLMQYNAELFLDTSADVTGPKTIYDLTDNQVDNVGSVLNFKSSLEMRKIQDMHLAHDRNKIPMLFMMDVIHGFRTIYPIPLAMGCSFDPELVADCSRMAAKEATAGGVHVTFTPMVDYVRDARWGRVMESCGEDVLLNSIMGAAQVKAFQTDDLSGKDSLACCVKHFAAYGGAEAGRDYNCVDVSEHLLREFYLPAYKACIDAGVCMVMPSFNTLGGVPAVINKFLMKKILKDEWNFDGVVISDYNALGEVKTHGITDDKKETARRAFECGCHIEMCSSLYAHYLEELVQEGSISQEQLDNAVFKVLDLKNKLGLFENPYHGACETEESTMYLSPQNRQTALVAAQECAVLLKNNGILPFSQEIKKIAIIGPFADEKAIIGFWSCNGRIDESVTVKEGIENLLSDVQITVVRGCGNKYNDTDITGFDEAILAAKNADAVILCLGEPQEYSGEGNSRTNIILPGVQNELAHLVAEANPNTAVITFSGRPLVLTELAENVPAILHMWFPGTEGGNAVANLLFGKANPCGKLSMSFPKSVGQCPLYYNHTSTGRPKRKPEGTYEAYASNYIDCGNLPLYSFGHGLSYCNFVYEELTLSSDSMTVDGYIDVSIKVKNNSDKCGKETVMLYMKDVYASTARPIQQLIAFEKASFEPDEEKTFTFRVDETMLRFLNDENQFISEKGEFLLSTGYADHLILTKSFYLK